MGDIICIFHFLRKFTNTIEYFYFTQQGKQPNPEFSKFEPALRSVTVAGSKSETTVDAATSFFGLYPEPSYYAYPGSYYEPGNQKQLFSATVIELPKSHYPSISIPQVN